MSDLCLLMIYLKFYFKCEVLNFFSLKSMTQDSYILYLCFTLCPLWELKLRKSSSNFFRTSFWMHYFFLLQFQFDCWSQNSVQAWLTPFPRTIFKEILGAFFPTPLGLVVTGLGIHSSVASNILSLKITQTACSLLFRRKRKGHLLKIRFMKDFIKF